MAIKNVIFSFKPLEHTIIHRSGFCSSHFLNTFMWTLRTPSPTPPCWYSTLSKLLTNILNWNDISTLKHTKNETGKDKSAHFLIKLYKRRTKVPIWGPLLHFFTTHDNEGCFWKKLNHIFLHFCFEMYYVTIEGCIFS